ncbi:6-pyruvoyl trahydropterin synthase family protein [Pontibacter sp. G13]|uniref:6-pyruvoyl trahydropterin synthase family protein n=1 Tax=Pontibacter sp. G13 TaxID=3074898 RepID=UPI0039064B98
MIAHSLPSPTFGPAQQLHGATYVVDATFFSKELDQDNIVLDIGLAHEILKSVLDPLRYQNLDHLPQFEGKLTSTEFLAHYIHQQISAKVAETFSGSLKVTLGESHVAWAAYEGPVSA